jgi:hypothetical protein
MGGGSQTYACVIDYASWSLIPQGNYAVYFGNSFCNACSSTAGDTSCLAEINCSVTGIPGGYPAHLDTGYGGTNGVVLKQAVSGLITGTTYVLEFWAGGEQGFTDQGVFAINVGFGDTLLRENPTPPGTGIGTRFIIEFNTTSASDTIKFTNWGHMCSSCTELVIDDVKLYTVDELPNDIPHFYVGINEISNKNEISVYPNPASSTITFSQLGIRNYELGITDVMGREVYHQPINNSTQTTINISQLSDGVYFYQLTNNTETNRGKFVVEK